MWDGRSDEQMFGADFHARMESRFGHAVDVDAYGECFPDENNRVALDPTEKDTFGLAIPQITVRHSDNSRKMTAHMRDTLTGIMRAAGAAEIRTHNDGPLMGTHLMGTCRMGTDAKTPVCNPFGRTHDVENLFVAGGSLFPTATPANPTLTFQALATRVAFHIDELFARRDI